MKHKKAIHYAYIFIAGTACMCQNRNCKIKQNKTNLQIKMSIINRPYSKINECTKLEELSK